MMSEIDTLKDQALRAKAAGDWSKLGVILGTLERIWTDDPAAPAFYAHLEKSAAASGAPPSITNPVIRKVNAMNAAQIATAVAANAAAVAAENTQTQQILAAEAARRAAAAASKPAKQTAKKAKTRKTRAAKPAATTKPAVKPAPAAKPAATTKPAAKPAAVATPAATKPAPAEATKPAVLPPSTVRFGKAYTKNYRAVLCPYGFTQIVAASPQELAFTSDDTAINVTIPTKPGTPAPFVVMRGKKTTTGAGHAALADLLGLPRLQRK